MYDTSRFGGEEIKPSVVRSVGLNSACVRACVRGYVRRVPDGSNCRAAWLRTEKDRAFIRFYQNSTPRVQVGGEMGVVAMGQDHAVERPDGVALD